MVNFEDGTLIKGAYVEIDGKEYPVIPAEYEGNTPISKENLNKAQVDLQELSYSILENLMGFELYTNPNGETGDIILSDFYYNYDEIEIFAGKDEIGVTSVKVPMALYSQIINIVLAQFTGSATTFQIVEKQMKLKNGDTLSVVGKPAYINFLTPNTLDIIGEENLIKVFRVVGHKYLL